jgi:hypothetical protein
MAIINCPACTKKFKGKDGLEGKRIKCPLCGTPFVVAAQSSDQVKAGSPEALPQTKAGAKKGAAKGSAPAMAKHQRVTWNKEDEDKDPYKLGEFDLRARCPNCANLMESEEAVICVFCGYNTQTREWGATVRTMAVTGGQHFLHLLPGFIFVLVVIGLIIGTLYFCLELPALVHGTWADIFDHESARMWIILFILGFMWAFAMLAYRRLVLMPRPLEKKKE